MILSIRPMVRSRIRYTPTSVSRSSSVCARKRLVTDADIDIGFVDARKFGGNLDGVGKDPDVDARYALIARRARQVG